MIILKVLRQWLLLSCTFASVYSRQKHLRQLAEVKSNSNTTSPFSWEVPAKKIWIPTTISTDLQFNIARAPIVSEGPPSSAEDLGKATVQLDKLHSGDARAVWKEFGLTVNELTIAGVHCYHLIPDNPRSDVLLLNIHGGGYIINSGPIGTLDGAFLANITRIPVISIDYRMAPQHPSPAALEDMMAVWEAVVINQTLYQLPPSKVGVIGGSAGGGLAMATTLKLAEMGKPGPGALVLHSPWSDISKTGDSYVINEMVDNVLATYEATLAQAAELYAGGKDLKDPYLSPVYGDLSVFPPTQIFAGTRDLLLSCAVRVHRKLRRAGVEAELHVFEGLSHNEWLPMFDVVQLARNLPEEIRDSMEETAGFLNRHLGGATPKGSGSIGNGML